LAGGRRSLRELLVAVGSAAAWLREASRADVNEGALAANVARLCAEAGWPLWTSILVAETWRVGIGRPRSSERSGGQPLVDRRFDSGPNRGSAE
jgi:hypothetical protein